MWKINKGWEKPGCDICQTDKHLALFYKGVTFWEHKGRFNFVKCRSCGLVLQSPRVPFGEVVNYYPSESYWGRDIRKKRRTENWLSERAYMFDFLYKGIFKRKKRGSILDIGSGLGLFLSRFKEKGWEVLGTDISGDAAKYSYKVFGVKVLLGDIVKMKLQRNHFDVVTLNGVFEHIYSPRGTLNKINRILKKDGVLVITVPNIESLGFLVYRREWYALQPGWHVYQYSPGTLSRILRETGFIVEEINHSYWAHNYHSLFESFRERFSPRFKKGTGGGLAKSKLEDFDPPTTEPSFLKEFGKLVGKILATLAALIEPIIERGEIITVYAKKA